MKNWMIILHPINSIPMNVNGSFISSPYVFFHLPFFYLSLHTIHNYFFNHPLIRAHLIKNSHACLNCAINARRTTETKTNPGWEDILSSPSSTHIFARLSPSIPRLLSTLSYLPQHPLLSTLLSRSKPLWIDEKALLRKSPIFFFFFLKCSSSALLNPLLYNTNLLF